MSYVFSDAEKILICEAAVACKGLIFNPADGFYTAVAAKGFNCEPLYQVLSDLISDKLSKPDAPYVTILKSAKLWLDVAIDANGGMGAYSALIRAYTLRQGRLRLDEDFSEDLMQKSSNQVAANLVNTSYTGHPMGS
jgi:hypothetical protein